MTAKRRAQIENTPLIFNDAFRAALITALHMSLNKELDRTTSVQVRLQRLGVEPHTFAHLRTAVKITKYDITVGEMNLFHQWLQEYHPDAKGLRGESIPRTLR